MKKSFGERVREERLARGWGVEDLAMRLDVSPGSISNWETGGNVPYPKTLRKLAAIFEVEVKFLLEGEGESAGEIKEKPGESELALWKRRAKTAEAELERIKSTLRKLGANATAADLVEHAASSVSSHRVHSGGTSRENVPVHGDYLKPPHGKGH